MRFWAGALEGVPSEVVWNQGNMLMHSAGSLVVARRPSAEQLRRRFNLHLTQQTANIVRSHTSHPSREDVRTSNDHLAAMAQTARGPSSSEATPNACHFEQCAMYSCQDCLTSIFVDADADKGKRNLRHAL